MKTKEIPTEQATELLEACKAFLVFGKSGGDTSWQSKDAQDIFYRMMVAVGKAEGTTPRESRRGFVTAPTLDQLKPTPHEKHLLKVLWDWQEQSAKSKLVLGQPLGGAQ